MDEVTITAKDEAMMKFDEIKEILLCKMSPKKVEIHVDPRYGTITLEAFYVDPPESCWY